MLVVVLLLRYHQLCFLGLSCWRKSVMHVVTKNYVIVFLGYPILAYADVVRAHLYSNMS